ncbi:MAG: hypothetical protein JSU63_04935 [Phycisphaerales bacterium]|nr:MAG: hypothetical protein JSU63_04935 [Phycisphaerales bacterium]
MLMLLDSRSSLGSDINRRGPTPDPYVERSVCPAGFVVVRTVRVVVGRLGRLFRLSAQELGVVVDAETFESAWVEFLRVIRDRADAPWLTFDVGPTRREEITRGLDAPEDEDWAEPLENPGVD